MALVSGDDAFYEFHILRSDYFAGDFADFDHFAVKCYDMPLKYKVTFPTKLH